MENNEENFSIDKLKEKLESEKKKGDKAIDDEKINIINRLPSDIKTITTVVKEEKKGFFNKLVSQIKKISK